MNKPFIRSIVLFCLSAAIITLILVFSDIHLALEQQPKQDLTKAQEPVDLESVSEIQIEETEKPNNNEKIKIARTNPKIPNVHFEMDDLFSIEISSAEDEREQIIHKSRNERYASITLTATERKELAACILLEAGSEPPEGQQAVAEVVFNRVLNDSFPNTVHGVLHFGEDTDVPQFSSVHEFEHVWPLQEQFDAIERALYDEPILDEDVVFFSWFPANDRVWGSIGKHVFCRENVWNQVAE